MIAGSFKLHLESNLLPVDCDLAKLANRSDKAMDIGNFPLQRNFTLPDPSEVKEIINQSRLELQITAYDMQVRPDCFWKIRISLKSSENRKDRRKWSVQLMA
jgi:hypothetical protein